MALKDYIQRAKQGDQEAFRYLLNKYWTDVYRFQKSLINNENEAEDITIETFARAFDKIGSFNEKYAFKNWLLTISKNIYLDKNKRKKRIDQSASLDDYPNLLNLADHSHEDDEILESKLSDLKKALAALKPAYRQVLELYYFQNLSYKEISEKTNVSLSNVKIRLMRAKKLLAGKLKKP
ncbi:MAG: RNA polymerase sigma factor [Chlorobi bacterium]|nr:RNA polymerase sigma factor [Chlorobiota bacterium]